ncbi:formyl transferase-domain-containing protein [Boletus edulis]|nr:formyl transferase-domain-containing protein [Boletus edulis]
MATEKTTDTPRRIAVLIFGSGQTLATPRASHTHRSSSSSPIARLRTPYGLTRATTANPPIPTVLGLPPFLRDNRGATRVDYDLVVAREVLKVRPDVLVLAGWMHIVSETFLEVMRGVGMISPSPSRAPEFDGANAIERGFKAFQRGEVDRLGVMVHRVIAEMDRGAPIIVREIEVHKGEDFTVASSLVCLIIIFTLAQWMHVLLERELQWRSVVTTRPRRELVTACGPQVRLGWIPTNMVRGGDEVEVPMQWDSGLQPRRGNSPRNTTLRPRAKTCPRFSCLLKAGGRYTETSDGTMATSAMDKGSAISDAGVQLGEADAVEQGEEEREKIVDRHFSVNVRLNGMEVLFLTRGRIVRGRDELMHAFKSCWSVTRPESVINGTGEEGMPLSSSFTEVIIWSVEEWGQAVPFCAKEANVEYHLWILGSSQKDMMVTGRGSRSNFRNNAATDASVSLRYSISRGTL